MINKIKKTALTKNNFRRKFKKESHEDKDHRLVENDSKRENFLGYLFADQKDYEKTEWFFKEYENIEPENNPEFEEKIRKLKSYENKNV